MCQTRVAAGRWRTSTRQWLAAPSRPASGPAVDTTAREFYNRAVNGPSRLAATALLLGGLAAPAGANAIIRVVPVAAASGIYPYSSSYRSSLVDLAAGAEVSGRLALAGGVAAVDYYGWWSNARLYEERPTALPLPIYGYVLVSPEEGNYNARLAPYLFVGAYPLAIPKYQAIVGTVGLGSSWSFYVVTVGAEFRTVFWYERHHGTKTTYLLQLNFGLGGWYVLGNDEGEGSWPFQ